jgi:ATP-dependent helicase/nuclease subunit A
LTRAEDRLVICGHENRTTSERCWYELIKRGMTRLPGVEELDSVQFLESSQRDAPVVGRAVRQDGPALKWPDWFGAALPEEPKLAQPLAPSQPADADLGPVPFAVSPLAAREAAGLRLKRGQMLHTLLQHLPSLPREDWEAAAQTFLARPGHALPPEQAALMAKEVLEILQNAELAPLFGEHSRAEVPLTGVVGERVVGGLVDRLAVLPDRVLIADYKTNRNPPASPEATPVLYLRQMAAYRAVLQGVFPDRDVACVLIWTQAGRVSWLPSALLDPHAPGAVAIAA